MKNKIVIVIGIVITALLVAFGCVKKEQNVNNEYVLNTRSKKIHIMSCDAVKKMSEKNKKIVKETLADLFKQKYVICKKCKAGIKKA